ncbi:uncharacterized protein LOC114576096 [Exaiptasia diaphana]|uniref:YqaJ viral recombinase domain-containing protein n=1 Tax=Exaiptasia diaphana TaxID=2652724 RepID=A0A913YR35_EXADI|nr:uncharacterized protein LOC114576096 [Exaiptasia diaphana]
MLGLKSVPPLISKTSKPQTWHIPSRLEGINPRAVTKLVIQKSKPKQTGEPYKKKRKVSGVRSTVYKPFEQPLQDIDLPGILAQTFSEIEPNPGFLRIWPDKEEEQVLVQSAYGEVPKGCVISYQQPLNAKKEPSIQLPGFEFPKLSYCHTVLGEREHLFFSALTVTHNQSVEFEVETREQSMTNAWHSLRKFRLTASNFKNICSRRKDFDTLSKRLLKGKFIQTAAMKYGIQNEDVAAKLYTKKFARETHKVGFLINPSVPHLGCSPDRRVHDNSEAQPWGLLEILKDLKET